MKRVAGTLASGLASFALTVAFVLGLEALTGLDLFTVMMWGFLPAGAFVTGLLAASGFYLGAVKLGVKATRSLGIAMLVVAALVQATLYYAHYRMAATESGRPVAELVGFIRFVGLMLSQAEYGLHVYAAQIGDAVQVGAFGYVIATVQLLALCVGGLVVHVLLADKPYCDDCKEYLRPVDKLQLNHSAALDGNATIEALRALEPLTEAYFDRLRELPAGADVALELELSRCAGCGLEVLVERPMTFKDGKPSYVGAAYRTLRATPAAPIGAKIAALRGRGATTRIA